MHLLDLIMYFFIAWLLWRFIDYLSDGEWTNELGTLIGLFVLIVYSIIYITLFAFWPDWNWIDFSLPKISFTW